MSLILFMLRTFFPICLCIKSNVQDAAEATQDILIAMNFSTTSWITRLALTCPTDNLSANILELRQTVAHKSSRSLA